MQPMTTIRFFNYYTRTELFELDVDPGTLVADLKRMVIERLPKETPHKDLFQKMFLQMKKDTSAKLIEIKNISSSVAELGVQDYSSMYLEIPNDDSDAVALLKLRWEEERAHRINDKWRKRYAYLFGFVIVLILSTTFAKIISTGARIEENLEQQLQVAEEAKQAELNRKVSQSKREEELQALLLKSQGEADEDKQAHLRNVRLVKEANEELQTQLHDSKEKAAQELQTRLRKAEEEFQKHLRKANDKSEEELKTLLRNEKEKAASEKQIAIRKAAERLEDALREANEKSVEELQIQLRKATEKATKEKQLESRKAEEELQNQLRKVKEKSAEELQILLRKEKSKAAQEQQTQQRKAEAEKRGLQALLQKAENEKKKLLVMCNATNITEDDWQTGFDDELPDEMDEGEQHSLVGVLREYYQLDDLDPNRLQIYIMIGFFIFVFLMKLCCWACCERRPQVPVNRGLMNYR